MSTTQNTPSERRTLRNLASALCGEEQARRQYLLAAEKCEAQQLFVAAHALRFTAAQEKEHAAIFRGLMRTLGGYTEPDTAPAPPPLPEDAQAMLDAAGQNEQSERERLYPAYADMAEEDGLPRIATAFRRIAETEALHEKRFRQYAQALRSGTLFEDEQRQGWLCLRCGHLHYGLRAPGTCSTCGRDQGHFIRSDFYPFTVRE